MTSKTFSKEIMNKIHELTEGLSDDEYSQYIEELVFELEAEHQKLSYQGEDDIEYINP